MTNHPYPPPPRRLERSTDDRVIGGVCSGIARYLNLDPTLVRLLVAVLTLTMGFPIVLYLVALFLMPEERVDRPQQSVPGRPPSGAPGPWPAPPRSREQTIWGNEGAPWEQPQPQPQPQRQPGASPTPPTTPGAAGDPFRDGPGTGPGEGTTRPS